MIKFTLTYALIFLAFAGFGQGWERVLSGGGQDEARAFVKTPDGGYFLTGSQGSGKILAIKTDADGVVQWTKSYLQGPAAGSANAVIMTPDSAFVMAGIYKPNGTFNQSDFWITKVDFFGKQIWTANYGGPDFDGANSIVALPDGSFIVGGYAEDATGTEDARFYRIDRNGQLIWTQTFGQSSNSEWINSMVLTQDGNLVAVGYTEFGPDRDVVVYKMDIDGNLIWTNTYGLDIVPGLPSNEIGNSIVEAPDGNLIIAGFTNSMPNQIGALLMKITAQGDPMPIWFRTFSGLSLNGLAATGTGDFYICGIQEVSQTFEDLFVGRVDDSGDLVWSKHIGRGGPDVGYAILPANDGGAVICGSSSADIILSASNFYLVKTLGDGTLYTDYITGNVFHDFNGNCTPDNNEPNLKNWFVKIASPDFTRYATTDANGHFESLVDTGTYQVTVIPPSAYWAQCSGPIAVTVGSFYDTLTVNPGVKALNGCPNNQVAVSTPLLRRCEENTYTVRYCNNGTIPSIDTRVEITLDSFLEMVSSSIPWTSQVGNTYSFPIGYLNNGDCGDFTVKALLRCADTRDGQTHCVNAHIFPDTPCNPVAWDGAIIRASADCNNGNVQLKIKNGGAPMTESLDFVVIEDQIMLTAPGTSNTFFYTDNEEHIVFQTPANGKTFRIIAEQPAGYPGESYPTAAVEGCTTDTTSNDISLGYYTMFPEDDGEPFLASDCQESVDASFNPDFLKRGHPKGFDTPHYIDQSTDLSYLIRFLNTGTDTISEVIIRDTLSPWLDPSSVVPGAGSHPYQFQVYYDGVVQFTINNLALLPTGSANENESSGYVSFRVSQKPNLPCGTEIFNSAAVYYDYNTPVVTNETQHTVCPRDSVIVVKTTNIHLSGAKVGVFPNPFSDGVFFDVQGVEAKEYTLYIYDIQNRLLVNTSFNHPLIRLHRSQLPAGTYLYRLVADGRSVASGSVVAQ